VTIFEGMQNHTAESIKSLEGFDRAWFEEAQNASDKSLTLLRPTIRKPGSQLWFGWNPYQPTDPIDVLLRGKTPPPDSVVVQANYMDNPWLPDVLRAEMEYDRAATRRSTRTCGWAATSATARRASSRTGRSRSSTAAGLGAAAGRGLGLLGRPVGAGAVRHRRPHAVRDARGLHGRLRDHRLLPDLFDTCRDASVADTADSARPETISHMQRHGFPKIGRPSRERAAWRKASSSCSPSTSSCTRAACTRSTN
jgi:phage terminase large subunit